MQGKDGFHHHGFGRAVGMLGLDGEQILVLTAVTDLFRGFNNLRDGSQVQRDERPWHG